MLVSRNVELRKRVVTGVVGATALVIFIIYGTWIGIFLLMTALSLGMIQEYSDFSFTLSDRNEKRYVLLFVAWFIAMMNQLAPQYEFQLLVVSFLGLFSYFLYVARRHSELELGPHFKELAAALFGIVYLVFLPLYLQKIYELSQGVKWTLLFLFIVWASDIGAYFVGKRFGRKKLYPLISPNKTVEGSIGGMVAALAVALIFKILFFKTVSWLGIFFLPLIISILSQIGDLCESFLKRAFGRKDSGSILPGHGGILDRFDAVVFSLPVMYACVRILG